MRQGFSIVVEEGQLHQVLHGLFERAITEVRASFPAGDARDLIISAEATLVGSVILESVSRLKATGLDMSDAYLAVMRSALTGVASAAVANGKTALPPEVSIMLQLEFGRALGEAHTLRRDR